MIFFVDNHQNTNNLSNQVQVHYPRTGLISYSMQFLLMLLLQSMAILIFQGLKNWPQMTPLIGGGVYWRHGHHVIFAGNLFAAPLGHVMGGGLLASQTSCNFCREIVCSPLGRCDEGGSTGVRQYIV